jgi:hypothetical protein
MCSNHQHSNSQQWWQFLSFRVWQVMILEARLSQPDLAYVVADVVDVLRLWGIW